MDKITVYSTTTCPYCHMEKDYLRSKNVNFEDKVVDNDQEALKEMVQLSGSLGVPFTVVETKDGKKEQILGFDKGRIDKILNLN